MLRFDLNLSLVLKETPPLARFDEAARLGFGAVEFFWPGDVDRNALVRAVRDAGVTVALFNFDAGDLAAGDRGLLSDRDRHARFRANVPVALELATQLGCTRLNAVVGKHRDGQQRADQLALARDNLAWAAELAAAAGITVVVELLNPHDNPGYLLRDTPETLAFLDGVGAANVRYLFDCYHVQRTDGDALAAWRLAGARSAHVQLADAPGRHQPGTGRMDYAAILGAIDASDYAGMVGAEFVPLGATASSLAWLPEDRRGPISVDALRLQGPLAGGARDGL